MNALAALRQAKSRRVQLQVGGQPVDVRRFEFYDYLFTIDLKPANALLDLNLTLVPAPREECGAIARLEFYLQPNGFASAFPFELRFQCATSARDRSGHPLRYSLYLEGRAGRQRSDIPFPHDELDSANLLLLLPTVQACRRAT